MVQYGMGDFIEDLKKKVTSRRSQKAKLSLLQKPIKRSGKSLDEIFGKLKKTKNGNHKTSLPGQGDEVGS
jgi:Ca-activated chloride channel family protein